MEYLNEKDIAIEFAQRTLEIWNLHQNQKYDVTLTINLMLGLVVIPKQLSYYDPKFFFKDDQFRRELENACTYREEPFTAEYVIRKVRNSICHGRMEIKGVKSVCKKQASKIESIRFVDRKGDSQPINFDMEVSVDLLKRFVSAFAQAVISYGASTL